MGSAASGRLSPALGIFIAGVLLVLGAMAVSAEPVVWSWEQELEPLDILEFVEDLPYDEWVEIDEVTCRQLFEDLIRRALEQMEIDGGQFEQMLRDRFFYFTPEREYYYPPYAEKASEREVLFPAKVERVSRDDYVECQIMLGRCSDDERVLTVALENGMLRVAELLRNCYYPGQFGPKKQLQLFLGLYEDKALATARWFNSDGSLFIGGRRLFEYGLGNPSPVVDNTANEPPLELLGIDILFDNSYGWSAYGPGLFQTYHGLVMTCAHQLSIEDEPYELEMFLWREILYYEDCFDYFGAEVEFANLERTRDLDPSTEEFFFDVGNAYTARYINVVLSQEGVDRPAGYDWRVESIVLTRYIMVSDDEVGQEIKELTIQETSSGTVLECWVAQVDEDEEEIAPWQIARRTT